uniref:Uncharacterized protein n=1 Tax=Anguilla anguilla TaxID=7936 RepID=A0A0E9U5U1_ANGAN
MCHGEARVCRFSIPTNHQSQSQLLISPINTPSARGRDLERSAGEAVGRNEKLHTLNLPHDWATTD